MSPPSPARDERKEQLLAWKQQRQAARASPTRPEPQQCRRNSAQAVMTASPERKTPTAKSTTATYTEQFLQRRRSEQLLADAANSPVQSPKANGRRRMERRRSSADSDAASERKCNEPKPTPDGRELLELPRENGHQVAAVAADAAVENSSQRTIDLVEGAAVVAESGKGAAAVNDGGFGNIVQDEEAAGKVAMTKKRRAPCSRSAVTLAVVAGVVTVSMTGGIVVCQLYPSSPAATSIRSAADKTAEVLYPLLVVLQNEVGPHGKELTEALRADWLALLQSERLEKSARAAQVLVNEELMRLRDSPGLTQATSIMATLVQNARTQLQRALLRLIDLLEMLVGWVQTHLKAMLDLIESERGSNDELNQRVRSILATARSSFEEALKEGAALAKSSVNEVCEWIGLESDVSDVNLPSKKIVASLETRHSAIQSVARGLTAQESRALEDVQRFEKRRVTIISAANTLIADTRATALQSVIDVKMAAVEFIESRIKQLAEQCARTIEQEFEEYERTSREAEEEGDVDMLAEIAADIQAKVKAAISLKRKLLDRAKATYEDPLDAAASDDQSTVEDESLSKRDDEEQHSDGAKLVEEELPDESVDGSLGSEDNTEEKMPAASKLIEEDEIRGADEGTTAVKYSPLEGVFDSVILTEEKVQITSDLAEPDSGLAKPDLLTVQRKEVQATEDASMSKSALNGEDGIPIVAELVEESVAAVEIVSVEEGEVAHGEITQAVITEVLVDLEDTGTVLGVKQTQVEVIKFADAENLSEVGSSKQDMVFMNGEQLEAHVNFPNEGVEMELMVELEDAAAEQVQVEQLPPDRSTRVRVQPGSSVPDEEFVEKAEHKKKDTDESTQVDSERFHLHEKEFVTHGSDMDLRVEQQGSEIAHEERVTVEEASTNVAELERPTAESASERNYDRVDIEAVAATLGEVETLETERVVVANEFQELEQLERMLLQEEGERVRVEEELRVIAEEEEVWLQNEQEAAEGVASSDDLAFEDSSTATIDAAKTADVDVDQKSSTAIPAVELPGPTLVQISLLSVAFLALAVLAAYLLDRHLKRGLFARAPRRRRRWKRRAASDAEEVVLMPDDSSDDEAETDTTIVKSSFEVMELRSSVSADVKTRALVSSGGEDADVEEETSEDHEEVEEAKEITEDGGVAVSDPESAKSKSVIVKRVQTTTTYVEDHAASHSEASVIDAAYLSAGSGSTAAPSSSISTPPSGSPEGTPDTSQRALRRRRRELRS